MRLTTSDIYALHRPTFCPLRVYLSEHNVQEGKPSAFEQILRTLGERHELAHLATLGAYEDFSTMPPEQRLQATKAAVDRSTGVIYQGEFASETTLDGTFGKGHRTARFLSCFRRKICSRRFRAATPPS